MYYFLFIPIFFALTAGLVFYKNTKPVFLSQVVVLLAITVLNELIVYFLFSNHSTRKYINYFYNGFSLIDMTVWFVTFYRINTNSQVRKLTVALGAILVLFSVIEIQFYQHWRLLHTNSMRLYCLSIILLSILYLNSLLSLEYHESHWNPYFYICSACIIYHSVLFGNLTILTEYQNRYLANMHDIFAILQEIANCFYYLILCMSFIVCYLTQRRKIPTIILGSSFSMGC